MENESDCRIPEHRKYNSNNNLTAPYPGQSRVSRCQEHAVGVLTSQWAPGEYQLHSDHKTAGPLPGDKLEPGMMQGPLNSGWNAAIFLVLFGAVQANRGIQTDDPTRCQSSDIYFILTSHQNGLLPLALKNPHPLWYILVSCYQAVSVYLLASTSLTHLLFL